MDVNLLVQEVTKAVLEKTGQKPVAAVSSPTGTDLKIPVGISNKHIHLSPTDINILFGDKGLSVFKELSQPGQFAAVQQVTVVGPKGVLENVRVLGPARKETQLEISPADAVKLGFGRSVPIRESGDLTGTPGISLVGPNGAVTIKQGVIIAARHIHMHTNDAKVLGVKDKETVSVTTPPGKRSVVFKEVIVRVSDQFKLEFHIDFDEANAAYLGSQDCVEICKSCKITKL